MKLILAPMDGVIDHKMRQLLTDIGGYDRCVTEFIRVTNTPVPTKVFRRLCPEIETGGMTPAGVPVYVQLLGGDAAMMARSALTGVRAGALGVDLNFGCPAKIVNRHDGGSILLTRPERVGEIVAAVRDQVDSSIPICAKIRLGFDHADFLPEIVERIDAAGATELCIHARTRMDGYKPPAYWHHIGKLIRPTQMKLIVNGEIWNAQDAKDACQQSGCSDLMIGRGGLACPDLARILKARLEPNALPYQWMVWQDVVELVDQFFTLRDSQLPRYAGNRTKQWLAYLKREYAGAGVLFQQIKRLKTATEIAEGIKGHRYSLEQEAKQVVGF